MRWLALPQEVTIAFSAASAFIKSSLNVVARLVISYISGFIDLAIQNGHRCVHCSQRCDYVVSCSSLEDVRSTNCFALLKYKQHLRTLSDCGVYTTNQISRPHLHPGQMGNRMPGFSVKT